MGFNKVIMIGNLTRDPQLSYLPNTQTAVCEVGLAVNRRWRSREGEQKEDVCFIDCKTFGKRAETLNQYTRKGQAIMIEGRLEFDKWETQDGSTRSKHRVVIENFQFLGRGDSGSSQSGGHQCRQQPVANSAPANQESVVYDEENIDQLVDDDIPF